MNIQIPYRRDVERYAGRLIRSLSPRAIVLYGSAAKGTCGVGSDIDLLIIADHLPGRFLDRLKVLSDLNATTAPIEALAYTRGEFEGMLARCHPTVLDALDEGKAIYDDGYFRQMRKAFKKLKKRLGLAKVEDGWEIGESPLLTKH